MTTANVTKVIVPCRLSYAHLWEPDSINGSEPKYSVSCIIDKNDKETIAKIKKAIEVAKDEGKGKCGTRTLFSSPSTLLPKFLIAHGSMISHAYRPLSYCLKLRQLIKHLLLTIRNIFHTTLKLCHNTCSLKTRKEQSGNP